MPFKPKQEHLDVAIVTMAAIDELRQRLQNSSENFPPGIFGILLQLELKRDEEGALVFHQEARFVSLVEQMEGFIFAINEKGNRRELIFFLGCLIAKAELEGRSMVQLLFSKEKRQPRNPWRAKTKQPPEGQKHLLYPLPFLPN